MKSEILTITPEQAKRLLATNIDNNRAVSMKSVRFYSDMMKRGQWMTNNGESIKISNSGKLIDGQHRLYAVIHANIPISFYITYGVDEKSFTTIDTGYNRSTSNIFNIAGIKYYSRISAIVSGYLMMRKMDNKYYRKAQLTPNYISKQDALNIYFENEKIFDEIQVISNKYYLKLKILSASMVGSIMAYLIIDVKHPKEVVFSFFYQLYEFEPCKNNTIKILRNKLINDGLNGFKMSPKFKSMLITKAWNAYVNGEKLRSLSWDEENDKEVRML